MNATPNCAAAEAPAVEPTPVRPLYPSTPAECLHEAIAINTLLDWVESARAMFEQIRLAAEVSPDLRAQLRDFDIRWRSLDWTDMQSEALIVALGVQRGLMQQAARGQVH